MYVTNYAIYFYSPFNEKTLIGFGTKIKMTFNQILDMKKESSMIIFPNCLRISLTTGASLLFTSFVSRDTCYATI